MNRKPALPERLSQFEYLNLAANKLRTEEGDELFYVSFVLNSIIIVRPFSMGRRMKLITVNFTCKSSNEPLL